MKDDVLKIKSKSIALHIIAIYKKLYEEKREFVMSKQLLKSGTSIGANIAEAANAQSNADFLAKMYIALKEAGETSYWLELLNESKFIDEESFTKSYSECTELIKLLTSTTKTMKEKLRPSSNPDN